MRTPNTTCVICSKPLYRRPFELKKTRHSACMRHRAEAQRREGLTRKQLHALSLGREKGTNHRTGYSHKEESKRKISFGCKLWWVTHPKELKARGIKIRGKKHYSWKGGSSKLNFSIRALTENRKWMDSVKARDRKCKTCGSRRDLESHHKIELAILIKRYRIKNREQARKCKKLWNLRNGKTLCRKYHYKLHGRHYED